MKIEIEINDLFDLEDIFEEKDILGKKVYVLNKDFEENIKNKIEEKTINQVIDTYFGDKAKWLYGQTKYDKDIKIAWQEFMESHKEEIIDNVSKRLYLSFSKKYELKEK